MSQDLVIVKLDRAKQALAEAKTIQQTKKILDIAGAAEIYAKRQKLGEDAITYAHAIKIEALYRLGELLRETTKNRGGGELGVGRAGKNAIQNRNSIPPTLQVLLNTETQNEALKIASVAQQLAVLPISTRKSIAEKEVTLTEALRQQRHAARSAIKLPKDIYRVIYADPPWQYSDTRAGLGEGQKVNRATTAAEQNYPTMSVEELCELEVKKLAAPDSVLWCWATFPLLPDALTVIDAWGFTYKTGFVWKKPRGSFGHYHKADAELLLLATRGSCTPDNEKRYSQILEAETDGHSKKPEAVRDMIDALYKHGPRIELFARRPAPGDWVTWGNEP